MAEICVIVPVYNVEKFLSRCIDSILNQSYQDFDVLLIDDGSADESGTICDRYAQRDARIHVIHQRNRGIAVTRKDAINWALRESDCRWIAFVDSDDCISASYLQILLDNAEKNEADISTCRIRTFWSESEIKNLQSSGNILLILTGKEACEEVYKINGLANVSYPGKLIRKHLFSNVQLPEEKTHEDEAAIPKILYQAKRIAVSNEILYYYFQSENSIMRKPFSINRFQAIEAIDSCIAFFLEKNEVPIVELAKKRRTVLLALSIAYARRAGIYDQVPAEYRMPEWKAFYQMWRSTSYDEFTWHLGKFYPGLVRPYSYAYKVARILHIIKD